MTYQSVTLRAAISRRFPDPVFHRTHGTNRHIFFVKASDVPRGLPLTSNPRGQATNKRVYKDVRASLMNELGEPNTFHLKHKGITLVASSVQPGNVENEFFIEFADEHGIVDGGHTYMLITEPSDEGPIPEAQHVKVEVLTNVPTEWLVDIAGGLNTSVQVQEMSLAALRGDFDWLKDLLRNENCFGQIAWRENDPGPFDARDIVSLLYCFNIFEFANNGEDYPLKAYSSKAHVLRHYIDHTEQYKRLAPLVPGILILHDTISRDAGQIYNQETGGRYGGFSFVDAKKTGEWDFPFTGKKGKYRLMNGALMPIFAAFRWLVEEDGETVRWRGGFDHVMECWRSSAAELVKNTSVQHKDLGRNPNALGKSRNHWANLYNLLAKRELLAQRT